MVILVQIAPSLIPVPFRPVLLHSFPRRQSAARKAKRSKTPLPLHPLLLRRRQRTSPNPRREAAAEMVYYALYVGAELDGLTNLQPRGGCDDPNFPYHLKLKCENCGEVTAKATYVTLSEQVDLPKGHGTAHLVQKCKLCGRDGTIVMIPGQGSPLTMEQSQKGEKTCLMVFDCRGYEPVEFSFGAGWKAESVHGTPFDIDCSEDEFSEYDEKGECPVELGKLQSTFIVVKKHDRAGKTRFV